MAMKVYGGRDIPLVQHINPILDRWMVLWDMRLEKEEESYSFMAEVFDHKPTLQEIKDLILTWYNFNIDNEILSGFVWKDTPVWLSMENLFNYKAAYDIAVLSEGKVLPIFKFGTTENPVYYKFESFEELEDFYIKAMDYVTQTLSNGWRTKDTINWSIYSTLLNET